MEISDVEIREALTKELHHKPTIVELSEFKKYLADCVPMWLKDYAHYYSINKQLAKL